MKLKQKVTDVEVIIGNCFPEVGEIGPWKYFKLSEVKNQANGSRRNFDGVTRGNLA